MLAGAAAVVLFAGCGSSATDDPAADQPAADQPAADQPAAAPTTPAEPVGPGVTTASSARIVYGDDPSQFGDLSRPAQPPPATGFPTVVLIHGGFWRAEFGLDLMAPLAADLVARGFAVWNIEYRRVGQPGGGWPGTLEDVAAAIDELAEIGDANALDLTQVSFVGHSAGGHLALWAASRDRLPANVPGSEPMVRPTVAIGQGPVVDLAAGDARGLGGGAVTAFLGGTAAGVPERYAIATPTTGDASRLVAVRGTRDGIVPAEFTLLPSGSGIEAVDVEGDDHFDLIDPSSASWAAVIAVLTGER